MAAEVQGVLTRKYDVGRIVPPQTPELIELFVRAHLEKEFAKLQTKSALKIENLSDGKPWVASTEHWNYQAAKRATEVRHLSLACAVLWG